MLDLINKTILDVIYEKTKKLNITDLDLLKEIQQNDNITNRELADFLNVSSDRYSQIIKRLKNNYIIDKSYILNSTLLNLNTLSFIAI